MNILFVCTGNTCRSPMAEALLKYRGSSQLGVRSAGVFAADGYEASTNAIAALREKGIEFAHSSSLLKDEDVNWATYILTMTSSHKQLVVERYPQYHEKIYTISEFSSDNKGINKDVIDPFGGSLAIYRKTCDELEGLIDQLNQKLG